MRVINYESKEESRVRITHKKIVPSLVERLMFIG